MGERDTIRHFIYETAKKCSSKLEKLSSRVLTFFLLSPYMLTMAYSYSPSYLTKAFDMKELRPASLEKREAFYLALAYDPNRALRIARLLRLGITDPEECVKHFKNTAESIQRMRMQLPETLKRLAARRAKEGLPEVELDSTDSENPLTPTL